MIRPAAEIRARVPVIVTAYTAPAGHRVRRRERGSVPTATGRKQRENGKGDDGEPDDLHPKRLYRGCRGGPVEPS